MTADSTAPDPIELALLHLKVPIVHNSVAMLFQIGTKVLSLLAMIIGKGVDLFIYRTYATFTIDGATSPR